jgi:GntR family transcriptional regulator/MocR family aminotransferase
MRIPLDRESAVPLYRQIESYFREGVLSGGLPPGTRLPAIRQLAHDLGVNRITVEAAYAEMQADGLIEARVGSGTYVLPAWPVPPLTKDGHGGPWPLWQRTVQARSRPFTLSPANSRQDAPQHPNPINFAGGVGDSRLYPADDLRKSIQRVVRREGIDALDYGDYRGHPGLRRTIAQVLTSQGIRISADNILITAGSQQALALISQLLLRPGDVVLTESPTYAGALDLFRALGFKVVGIPTDECGMEVEGLEKLLQGHPRLIYTMPNFHNPTGTCLSSQRRRHLIALADRYNVPILEDDFVGDLRYDGRAQPPLKALEPGGRVIYMSTFSTMLMPGLRVGFIAAEGPVYDSLASFKRVSDLATSSLIQHALEAFVTIGRYQAHLRHTRQVYRRRRDGMLKAIDRHLPAGVRVNPPQGGIFVWLGLPDGLSAERLLPLAREEGVSFAPGGAFFPRASDGDGYIRLNFATQPQEETEEGMRRLGRAIRRLAALASPEGRLDQP